jgi:tetratricopeptide (TPR) repeat protein
MTRMSLVLSGGLVLVSAGCAGHVAPSVAPASTASEVTAPGAAAPPVEIVDRTLEAALARTRLISGAARPVVKTTQATSIESRYPALAEALAIVEASPTAENNRLAGEAYRQVGVLDQAHQYFSEAVRLDPSDAAAYDGLARVWRDWGYPNLGLGDAYRAVYHAPKSAAAYNTLGTLLQALGLRGPARQAYDRALALDSGAAYAFNNLCYLSFLDGNRAAASRECQAALELLPGSTVARNNLGLVYASLGELQSARREFSSATHAERAPYNLGVVQFAAGNYADAARSFESAYDANPALRAAGSLAERARQLAGRQASSEGPEP